MKAAVALAVAAAVALLAWVAALFGFHICMDEVRLALPVLPALPAAAVFVQALVRRSAR